MDLFLCLYKSLSDFRPLFNQQTLRFYKRLFSVSSQMAVMAHYQVFINQVVHRQDIGLLLSFYHMANGMRIRSQRL